MAARRVSGRGADDDGAADAVARRARRVPDALAANTVHGALRCLGERANSLLKTTFKALRRYRGCPWRIGDIVAAALVLLHHEHHRTT